MKIVRTFIQIGLFTLMIMTAFLLLTSKTDKIGGIQSFVVLTGSMQPTIPQGSVTFTLRQNNYAKGDIIAFKKGNITITHRVVGFEKLDGYITRGDANNVNDTKPIAIKDILGKEVLHIPFLGSLLLFIKTIPGFIAFVIVPALFFIVSELLIIKKELEKEIEKKVMQKISII